MKYTILLCLLAITACKISVYTNEKFSRKVKQQSYFHSNNDSCFVLGEKDNLPPGVVFVSDLQLVTPLFWRNISPSEIMANLAKEEAQIQGANLVKSTGVKESKRGADTLCLTLYRLEGTALFAYHRQRDSIAEVNRHFAIVHIWNYVGRCCKTTIPVYFNDSFAGSCERPSRRKKGFGLELHELELRFTTGGTLAFPDVLHPPGPTRHIEPGREYVFYILPGKYGHRVSP